MTAQAERNLATTAKAGLIGCGIGGSRTPRMHMAEGNAQGLDYDYALFDMDQSDASLADAVQRAQDEGFLGLNITFPFKVAIIELLDELSPNAKSLGAVNTVVFRDGMRFGHNTDLWGFAEAFRREFGSGPHQHALLIGAGGAGVAVAHALADCGVKRLSVHDIDPARAKDLAAHLLRNRQGIAVQAVTDLPALIADDRPEGIVNATPMGMAKLPGSAFPAELLTPQMWVADIVYFPLETELLRAARARGCRTLSGAGMAVFQAVRAFQLMTGRPADPKRMKAAFDAFDRPVNRTPNT